MRNNSKKSDTARCICNPKSLYVNKNCKAKEHRSNVERTDITAQDAGEMFDSKQEAFNTLKKYLTNEPSAYITIHRKVLEQIVASLEISAQPDSIFQLDDQGNHRIVVNTEKGDWAGYNHVSRLKIGNETYVGFTGYWEGALPIEQVLKLDSVPSKSEIVTGTRPK